MKLLTQNEKDFTDIPGLDLVLSRRCTFRSPFGKIHEHMAQDFTATPLLETAVHRFVVRIVLWQRVPLRPRVQNPQDGFEHIARRNRFASRTAFRNMFVRKMLPDALPVFIGIHLQIIHYVYPQVLF